MGGLYTKGFCAAPSARASIVLTFPVCGVILFEGMLGFARVLAPAKVNFGLRVKGRRGDGFHEIESVFQAVSLCDEIEARAAGGRGRCEVFCEGQALPERNTIVQAYGAFESVTGMELPSVEVKAVKRIPQGAGLGGGSSDAAAMAKALESISGARLSEEQKKSFASLVGSDVFFFMLAGSEGCAVVSGRGEVVRPIRARRDLNLLLLFPGFRSSTKEAYSALDSRSCSERSVGGAGFDDLEAVYRMPVERWTFANSFTPSLAERFPAIQDVLCDLRSAGASYCEVSGSGSAVYGVFHSREGAESARLSLAGKWNGALAVPFQAV